MLGIVLTEIDVEEMRSKLRLKDYNNKNDRRFNRNYGAEPIGRASSDD